jgi:hypothetical protein
MTTLPQSHIARGHEEPFATQFSVFLANRVGQLNELLRSLIDSAVELAGISVFDSAEWAVVRLVFRDSGKGREFLLTHKITFTECDVLAVVMDEPHTLQLVCKHLVATETNLHFAYPLLVQHEGKPVMAIYVDDIVPAVEVLLRHNMTLLDHEDFKP